MKPTHTAYSVRNFGKATGDADAEWLKIGVAFMHTDGHGYDVVLDALPVNGRVVLRTNDERIKELKRKMAKRSSD